MQGLYFRALLLFGLYNYGNTIMCYECNSAINSLCLDKTPPATMRRNCTEHDKGVTHTLCRKIIQHVDYGVNGELPDSRVIRSCGWDETKFKGQCYHRAGYGGRQEVCSCSTDLCNGAAKVTSAVYQIAVTTVLFTGTILHQ